MVFFMRENSHNVIDLCKTPIMIKTRVKLCTMVNKILICYLVHSFSPWFSHTGFIPVPGTSQLLPSTGSLRLSTAVSYFFLSHFHMTLSFTLSRSLIKCFLQEDFVDCYPQISPFSLHTYAHTMTIIIIIIIAC